MYSTLNVNHAVVTSSRANSWILKCHNSIIMEKFSSVQLTMVFWFVLRWELACAHIIYAITYGFYDIANIFHPGTETEHV